MTRIELAPEVFGDVERILNHLAHYEASDPPTRLRSIIDAIGILETNPRIGRPTDGGKRELIIGRDRQGYVALYRYVDELDTVLALGIRSQREAGYRHE
jgi:plasmid stabilization system protein ParE